MPEFSVLLTALGSRGGAVAVLGSIILLGVIWLMSGRMIPKASLEREVAAANRRADDHKANADQWREVATVLSSHLPRIVTLAETTDAYIRGVQAASRPPALALPQAGSEPAQISGSEQTL